MTKKLIFKLVLLSLYLFFGIVSISFGQDKSGQPFPVDTITQLFHSSFLNAQSFLKERIGQPFPDIDTLKTINNAPFYFNKINKPTVVFIGFKDCYQCMIQMSRFIKISNDPKYNNYNFVYLTPDDSATIYNDLKVQRSYDLKRLKIVHATKALINRKRLILNYPTLYFLNSSKEISYVGWASYINTGVDISNPDTILRMLYEKLDALK